MAQDLQKISSDIGKLAGLVEAMTARLDHNDQTLGDFMTSTSQSRLKLHERIEEQRTEFDSALTSLHERIEEQRTEFDSALTSLQSDLHSIQQSTVATAANLAALTQTVATDVKPQTDKIRRWELMGVGFLSMAGIEFWHLADGLAGAGIGVVLANWGEAIYNFLKR